VTGRTRTYWATIGGFVSALLATVSLSELPMNSYWIEEYTKAHVIKLPDGKER